MLRGGLTISVSKCILEIVVCSNKKIYDHHHHRLGWSGCSADGHVLHEGGHDVDRDWEHDCAVVLR